MIVLYAGKIKGIPFQVEIVITYVLIGCEVTGYDDAVVQEQDAKGQKHDEGVSHVQYLSPGGYQEFS